MTKVKLTGQNYYGQEAGKQYFSASQYNSFCRCEAQELAKLKGEWETEPTIPMLVGSYVDAHFSGELEEFKEKNPEIFLKDGETLKASFRGAETMIDRVEREPVLMEYMEGDNQTILTGEIAGVQFKGKLDVLHEDRIVDLKTTSTLSKVWNEDFSGKVPFLVAYGYIHQAAVYQELVRQTTGKMLPYYILAVTRETIPDVALLEIPQSDIEAALDEIEDNVGRFQAIKLGLLPPERCEVCDYCKETKTITGPVNYHDYKWE